MSQEKEKKPDALESFHIYKEAKAGNQINDKLMVRGNELYLLTYLLHGAESFLRS